MTNRLRIDHRLWLMLLAILSDCQGAVAPLYMMGNAIGTGVRGAANARARQVLLRRQDFPLSAHSLFSQRARLTSSTSLQVLDFFDPLEPFEMAWELYCNRYEIMEELLAKLVRLGKHNLVRAGVVVVPALLIGEVMARFGVLGERGHGLWDYIKESERFRDGGRERAYQKTSTFMLDKGMDALQGFRRFGGRSKFAVSVSAGALFGQMAIKLTTLAVKTTLISFFVLETMSFLGIIGEPGESILDWVDDQKDANAGWTKTFARNHKDLRKKPSFEWLEELYEAAVDEEKIASFGFSVGTIVALLT